ncbi:MAG: YegS/Rv2252/BmrU family lipid kinase [Oscillospiraceae bacterium]|nr:YegS/Rv2252/BmrU family lipid kinase [Oscillospiraceae bacterium]
MLKSLMLIVNPFSGRGKAKEFLYDILEQFCHKGYLVNVFLAGGPDSVEELARKYAGGFEMVVCVGGDGTLSDTISGLMYSEVRPPVGYIPMGTANDMASTLDLSHNPVEAAKRIVNGTSFPLDVGAYKDRFFTYVAAFGAFTEVSYSTPQNEKRALGHLAYVFRGISSVASIKPKHTVVEYDGGVLEDDYIFGSVTNSTSVAGMVKLDPSDVSLSDGEFEIILVKQPMNLVEFSDLVDNVTHQNFQSENLKLLHSKKVRFTFDEPVDWTRDGENGGRHRVIEIENRASAIQLIL